MGCFLFGGMFCCMTCRAWTSMHFFVHGMILSVEHGLACLWTGWLVVSIPQLNHWGSPSIVWEGSVCSRFPAPAHTAVCTSAVLPATLAAALSLQWILVIWWRLLLLKVSLTSKISNHKIFGFSPDVLTRDNRMLMYVSERLLLTKTFYYKYWCTLMLKIHENSYCWLSDSTSELTCLQQSCC